MPPSWLVCARPIPARLPFLLLSCRVPPILSSNDRMRSRFSVPNRRALVRPFDCRPIGDALGQPPHFLVGEITDVMPVTRITRDKEHRGRARSVLRCESDPESPVSKPAAVHLAIRRPARGPALPA